MPQYLLSVHVDEGVGLPQMSEDDMKSSMEKIGGLEADMRASNTLQFSGRLHGADTATVVRKVDGRRIVSDGPYIESKEHLGGFYVIEAADLDEALMWADRTVDAVGMPIEVWPFAGTGR